jgi:hypothetical protein
MSQAYSGTKANVKSGSTDMDAGGWSADYEISTFDSTTTADGGWEDETAATQKISGSFDFFYNIAKKPTGSTANLTPGSTPTLTLYVNTVGGDALVGVALVKKLSLKSKVKDGFMVTASFTSKGVWTVPS